MLPDSPPSRLHLALTPSFPARPRWLILVLALLGLSPLGRPPAALAAAPIVLHGFAPANAQHVNTDGAFPVGGVTQGGDGDWYGVTLAGGPSGGGAAFKMHPDGSGFTLLKTFSGSDTAPDGGYPGAPLRLGRDGFLYGTTSNGGANSDRNSSPGTIFRISPVGQFQTIFSFPTDDADPAHGGGQVFQAGDGTLYGDVNTMPGSLFRMNPDGTGYQVTHTFAALDGDALGTNVGGAYPVAVTAEGADGSLYGGAVNGGLHGAGTVFKIAKDGTGFTVLHDFNAANPQDGVYPSGDLRKGLDGAFYGTALQGGANNTGIVFRIDLSGGFRQVVSFPALSSGGLNSLGAAPVGIIGLAQGPDGTLYGTTQSGGANGYGTIFAVRPDGSGLTDLLDLRQSDTQAAVPAFWSHFGVSFGSDGRLYVTTDGGGANGTGAVLSLAPPSHTHLLWANPDGKAAFWDVAPDGTFTVAGVYGPYTDGGGGLWSATALATGPDGVSHVVWNNPDGKAALWTVQTDGSVTGATGFGPYADGSSLWHASGVSVGPDGAVHLLWANPDGKAAFWDVTPGGSVTGVSGYGPYSDGSSLWGAAGIFTGPDGVSHLLWDNPDGKGAFWTLDGSGGITGVTGYGPYSDGGSLWGAVGVSTGPDGVSHLLWANPDGKGAFWTLGASGGIGAVSGYGPYTDGGANSLWAVQGLATGADGVSHLLWANPDGKAALWGLDGSGGIATVTGYGPFTDGAASDLWSAAGVSAGP